mmetsp:Transcript_34400/g.85772  ORF Transcript_34400/g.85772 Transcript_34400/m.85772 type:complete len:770 (+) Transcript_34400:116-2425(+)
MRRLLLGGRGALRMLSSVPSQSGKIVYTLTDEAPRLATYSLLPIVNRFTSGAGISLESVDISVAARILALFPEALPAGEKQEDTLAYLGQLSTSPTANVVKLPNVSASVPQLLEAISELQAKGYKLPPFPSDAQDQEALDIRAKYGKVLGSAVNPVLREGNSDRRVAEAVKAYAKANPTKMGPWRPDSLTHVAHMDDGDFYGAEQSYTVAESCSASIVLEEADGYSTVLKKGIQLSAGEVIDASAMDVRKLRAWAEREIDEARRQGLLLSLHLKATMMKVSDPVIFGHVVRAFYAPVFEKYAAELETAGADPSMGLASVLKRLHSLPEATRKTIEAQIEECYEQRPKLAMVDSRKGITNLHVPSDIIVDASMPNVVRDSGCMWNSEDKLQETKCLIPDRAYATMYNEVLSFCKEHGQFDPRVMGNVANVGLMAQKAEEYGSHDKTFVLPREGMVKVMREGSEEVIFSHKVQAGDIWRMCSTKDEPIKDWVRLAVDRARKTMDPVIFWLDPKRAHDGQLILKVNRYLATHDLSGLDISIKEPVVAMRHTLGRARVGLDTVSVTGNVLRDYLTDLFPILELGTSSKMLSIVPLLGGGGLYETGAGGSAPKHVQQFVAEGHLRWDSLGEYLALGVSLEDFGAKHKNEQATRLGQTLSAATQRLLEHRRAPGRKVGELDNRGESFYIALYWAEAMAAKDEAYKALATELASARATIVRELAEAQGHPVDIGGYYMPDPKLCAVAMRPSATFNKIIDEGRTLGTCGVAAIEPSA